MNREVWLNGSFVAEQDAHIGIDDGGWLHGAGLFETMERARCRVSSKRATTWHGDQGQPERVLQAR